MIKSNFLYRDKIEFSQDTYKIVLIPDSEIQYFQDNTGREAWVFTKNQWVKSYFNRKSIELTKGDLLKMPPPWAAVIKGANSEGTSIYTDIYGLQHLYMRTIDKTVFIGTNLTEIASVADVHINYTAAFELISRGNPQQERTLFQEVTSLFGAQVIKINKNVSIESYWDFSEPRPCAEKEIIDLFSKTLLKIVKKRYSTETVLELTAGRDSMLMLSAFLKEKLPVKAWTHGFSDSFDLLGAQARKNHFSIPHQSVFLDPLLNLEPQETYLLFDEFLSRSNGMANILQYWYLPWVLRKVDALKSMSGVGGEVFRGFYYEWMGKNILPQKIGRHILIHGKLREHMPFNASFIGKKMITYSNNIIEDELVQIKKYSENYWQSLDVYYLRHRMHYFAGTTFSTVRHWREPELPLFDPEIIELLPLVPIDMRMNYKGITDMVTRKHLNEINLAENNNRFKVTSINRVSKLAWRLKQLKGKWIAGKGRELAWKVLMTPEAQNMLNISDMKSACLYKLGNLNKTIKTLYENKTNIPIPIGAILTIEALCRKIKANILE